jgi:hypothetical protein
MLPEGLKKCPACGEKLPSENSENFSCREILSISLYIFGIVLVPLVIAVTIGLLCLIFFI